MNDKQHLQLSRAIDSRLCEFIDDYAMVAKTVNGDFVHILKTAKKSDLEGLKESLEEMLEFININIANGS